MVTDPLLSNPRIALGRTNVAVTKHFSDVLQWHTVIEHHVGERMTGKVCVKRSFDAADHCKLFQVDIVSEIAVDRN
ncbi:hypothetical protein D3C87_1841080 [compost metagenome]